MLQYKDISCVKWLGISIIFYQFFWLLASSSLETKNTEVCKPLNESERKPGLACKCGEDTLHSLDYVIKRYSYNMTCIDCPPGFYYDFEVFDCRPCPHPNHNCFKHNNARRDCISCDAMEPPSPSSQASTTATPTTFLPTEKPVSFSMQSTQTTLPMSRELNSRGVLKITSPAESTTSALAPNTSEATIKQTTESTRDPISVLIYGVGVASACGVVFGLPALVWCYCKKRPVRRVRLSPNLDVHRNGGISHFQMVELPV